MDFASRSRGSRVVHLGGVRNVNLPSPTESGARTASPASGIAFLSMEQASVLIAAGRLSPVELTEAYLERISRLDGKLHAFITVTPETARREATQAEGDIRAGRYLGPLHGIPIAHKDIFWTKDVRTTANSRLLRNWIPDVDATVVSRLREAGAVCLGKTTLHEFAFGSPGPDEAFPAARNPWHVDYAPGSSSSGSAAAVSGGLCMAATGSDTGGSIRFPASVCGAVGMKPTYGCVSTYGAIPLSPSMDHVGPLTRTVRDNALMLEAMVGFDPLDACSLRHPSESFQRQIGADIRGFVVGMPRRFVESQLHHPEMLKAFERAGQVLEELGAELLTVDIPELHGANEAAMTIIAWEAYRNHAEGLKAHPEMYGATFRERIAFALGKSEEDYLAAHRKAQALRAAYGRLFSSSVNVLLTPGGEEPALPMADLLANPTRRSGAYRMYNLTGIPALSMPAGFSHAGFPLGIQIAGPPFGEALIYQVAAALESALALNRHPDLE